MDWLLHNAFSIGAMALISLFGAPIGYFIGKTLGGSAKHGLIHTIGGIDSPGKRELALNLFHIAERLFGTGDGDKKFQWVKSQFLKFTPDQLDGVAESFLQGLYDAFKATQSQIIESK